jgi:hypothetical protein
MMVRISANRDTDREDDIFEDLLDDIKDRSRNLNDIFEELEGKEKKKKKKGKKKSKNKGKKEKKRDKKGKNKKKKGNKNKYYDEIKIGRDVNRVKKDCIRKHYRWKIAKNIMDIIKMNLNVKANIDFQVSDEKLGECVDKGVSLLQGVGRVIKVLNCVK